MNEGVVQQFDIPQNLYSRNQQTYLLQNSWVIQS